MEPLDLVVSVCGTFASNEIPFPFVYIVIDTPITVPANTLITSSVSMSYQ